ncbi:MAG: hypothetical protein ACREBR_02310, partial [bacterium]
NCDDITWFHHGDSREIDQAEQEQIESHNIENLNGLSWNCNGTLPHPTGKSEKDTSTIKPEYLDSFQTPISSCLAFIPIVLWETMVFESNKYAEQQIIKRGEQKICGATWSGAILLREMMTFFGILIHMALSPTPGRTYSYAWKHPDRHPYAKAMPLRRFQQIRAVIHLNDNEEESETNDSLHKVRYLLNTLKCTLGMYLDVGRELALDEAIVTNRSSYGRQLIFYNPTKNCGKYHFRFYLICCATTYACLRLRMHTKDVSDLADGPNILGDDVNLTDNACGTEDLDDSNNATDVASATEVTDEHIENENLSTISKLVLDMARPLQRKGHVINMDNYYTSPIAFIHLIKKGIFARGTARTNRRHFPKPVIFTKQEAKNKPRGSIKVAVNDRFKMTAVGWLDGNPVHMLSTADGTENGSVTRRIGGQQQPVRAPVIVKHYNNSMQAVDRHDQLRALFSLCKRHGFKKYYVKIILALIDIALTNAAIHYFLANPADDGKRKDDARADFLESIANAMIDPSTMWTSYSSNQATTSLKTIWTKRQTAKAMKFYKPSWEWCQRQCHVPRLPALKVAK